ncbi:hypothetical protein BDV18DRAFT_155838 [Aspergillus unguis]
MHLHRVVVPKSSSVHRFACLALYRALLRRCNDLRRNAPQLDSARLHIRGRFRKYKNLQSPSQTANALKAGYQALDLVHSALQGNENDAGLITKILSQAELVKQRKRDFQATLSERRPVKPLSKKKAKAAENRRQQELTDQPHPERKSILSRPHLMISGKRHVPAMVNAGGIPILRIKKPQPQNLSRIIRTKIMAREKLTNRRERLETDMFFGEDEDVWDRLTGTWDGATFTQEIQNSLNDIKRLMYEQNHKKRELAENMWRIILAERKLFEEERRKTAST